MNKVYLVGAGPGDYRLITQRGLNLLKEADVIFYDRLVNPSLLAFIPPDIEKIYVGKSRGEHSFSQSEINEILVKEAKKDRKVVRLKGGDPFVFGRGGEEALTFKEAGVEFEIVPGISSVIAAATYAGIPVTHRGISSSFHVFTGHNPDRLDFTSMDSLTGTIIIVMGLKNLERITSGLMENGQDEDRPVAVVHYGTTSNQQVISGKLKDIAARVREKEIKPPVLTIIGEVVNLRDKISWFNQGPLAGKRIMITRPWGQHEGFGNLIEDLGGEILYYPTIEIKGPVINEEVRNTLASPERYEWIFFTSKNGVNYFFQALKLFNLDIRRFSHIKFGVIGNATGSTLQEHGIKPDYMPVSFTTAEMVDGFLEKIRGEKSILLPRADIATEEMVVRLEKAGHRVKNISIYRTVLPVAFDGEYLCSHIKERSLDLLTFTSPSTVRNLYMILEDEIEKIREIPAACIGPVTAREAEKLGFRVEIAAEEHSIKGLVEAIKGYF